jgi:hypothetical protein
VPFHPSAIVRAISAPLRKFQPTASQPVLGAALQDTASRTLVVVPAGRRTVWWVKLAPFHDSAKATLVLALSA